MTGPAVLAGTEPGEYASVFTRMRRNLGWLLGGRGIQAVASLVYLGIATRALGPHGFGEFSLALAYGQAIANVTQFQSWQGVIRYGALHLARSDEERLARLLGLTTTLDVASAVVGAALAALGVALVGPWLGWSAAAEGRAAFFGVALLLSTGATPAGILRLLDRFDLITYCQAVGPIARVIGSAIVWLAGGGIGAFLAVWAGAALCQSAATWAVAIGRAGRRPALGKARFGRSVAENQGILRFMLTANASSSVGLLLEQLGTLAIGGVVGAVAAGGFRVAAKLARSLARPVEMIARVLYPELARLLASGDDATLARVMTRTTGIAIGTAVLIVLIAMVGGPLLLQLLAGRAYRFAHLYLVLLAIASAIELSGFALEPLLTARGGVGQVLRIRLTGATVFGTLTIILLPAMGAVGVAVSTIVRTSVERVQLGRETRRTD